MNRIDKCNGIGRTSTRLSAWPSGLESSDKQHSCRTSTHHCYDRTSTSELLDLTHNRQSIHRLAALQVKVSRRLTEESHPHQVQHRDRQDQREEGHSNELRVHNVFILLVELQHLLPGHVTDFQVTEIFFVLLFLAEHEGCRRGELLGYSPSWLQGCEGRHRQKQRQQETQTEGAHHDHGSTNNGVRMRRRVMVEEPTRRASSLFVTWLPLSPPRLVGSRIQSHRRPSRSAPHTLDESSTNLAAEGGEYVDCTWMRYVRLRSRRGFGHEVNSLSSHH